MRFTGALLILLSVLLAAPLAAASEVFDGVIKSELGLPPGPLLCTTCHASLIGGVGTVVKPFGRSAMELGLQKLDVEGLKRVLHEMETTNVDSDCDGIGDIAELKAQSDPNSNAPDASEASACEEAFEPPRYGCSVGLNGRATTAPLWILLLTMLPLLTARRILRKG